MMNLMKKKLALCLVAVVSGILFWRAFWNADVAKKERPKEEGVFGAISESGFPVIAMKPSFYDKETLFESVDRAEEVVSRSDVPAIITPHHFVASDLMAEIIKSSSGRNIRTVAIVGPNHFNVGNDSISSAKVSWQTPYGEIAADGRLVDRLLADFRMTENPDVFENEHSVGAIVPFVRYYFPHAKIVPIVLSSYAGRREASAISQWLARNIGDDGLVIFSIDFSHYLTKEAADEKDAITRQLILDGDVEKIVRLGNDNVDCPPALAASLLYAKEKQLITEIVRNSNSFDFSREKPSRTTSYFTIRFLRVRQ